MITRLALALALLIASPALAQQIQVPKELGYGVFQNQDGRSAKLISYGVFISCTFYPKLIGYGVFQSVMLLLHQTLLPAPAAAQWWPFMNSTGSGGGGPPSLPGVCVAIP